MCSSTDRHPSADFASIPQKWTKNAGNANGSMALEASVPNALKHFTLYSRRKVRALQFDGEILAEAQTFGVAAGYRAVIYKTRDGNFVSEFSLTSMPQLTGGDPETDGNAAMFDSLDAACAWFQSRHLSAKLLEQVGKWGPESIGRNSSHDRLSP